MSSDAIAAAVAALPADLVWLADHRAAIGGPAPRRIVAVWLIAVSLFQRRVGECDWADIALDGPGGTVSLL
jgi:hypothetical protein